MNVLPPETLEYVRSLVRQGLSIRTIAAKAGIAKMTAARYVQQFYAEAPKCDHAKTIYQCSTCVSYRRIKVGDKIVSRIGPRARTEDVLKEALRECLDADA